MSDEKKLTLEEQRELGKYVRWLHERVEDLEVTLGDVLSTTTMPLMSDQEKLEHIATLLRAALGEAQRKEQ